MENAVFYMKLDKLSLLYCYYVFMDTVDYLADKLFVDHNVNVHFGPEFAKDGSPYRMITCHVRKKDESSFLKALEELPRKAMLCGYPDFQKECKVWVDRFEEFR